MRQSKTLLTIDERGSNIARNSVFDCHLSPVERQMAIENSVSNDSVNVFDCRLPGVVMSTCSCQSVLLFFVYFCLRKYSTINFGY